MNTMELNAIKIKQLLTDSCIDMDCNKCPYNNYGDKRNELSMKYTGACGHQMLLNVYQEIISNKGVNYVTH